MSLIPQHRQHFIKDSWTDDEITQAIALGVRSVSKGEASRLLGYTAPSAGIWFPSSNTWGQLRPDVAIWSNGEPCGKYIGPKGGIGPQALWLPPGVEAKDLDAATEGWKDGVLGGNRGGRAIGAFSGVDLISKVLPKGCEVPIIFDSDAWVNASVMIALVKGGLHTGGKVAIVTGDPAGKRGLTEFTNDGGDVAALLATAQKPKDLFKSWLARLLDNPTAPIKNCDNVAHLYTRVMKLARKIRLKAYAERWQHQHWAAYKRELNRQMAAQQVLSLADAPIGEFESLQVATGSDRVLYALNGQMGTSKTSKAIFGAVANAVALGQRVLFVVPTRFLSEDIATRLRAYLFSEGIFVKVSCHLDENQDKEALVRVTCGESLHKDADRRWDVMISDEANETTPRLLLGTLGKNPKAARAAFIAMLAQAQTIIIANDGIYRPVLEAVARLAAIAPEQTQIIARRRAPHPMGIMLYTGRDGFHTWAAQHRAAIQAGEKVAFPTGSQRAGRKMERWINESCPDKNIRVIDRPDTLPEVRKAVAKGPDKWIRSTAPDEFAWSPVFNSGISIEEPYFTTQFEYSAPQESATATLQRGSRVRAALGGGLINRRHVFLQTQGMPTTAQALPVETFTADYWRSVLSKPTDQLERILKPLGLGDVGRQFAKGIAAPIDEHPELAEMMAIKAREIHLKQECLLDEYDLCSYQVTEFEPLPEDEQKAIAGELRDIYETMLNDEGQTYATAPSIQQAASTHAELLTKYYSDGEPATPQEVRWFDRWRQEEKLGAIAQMNDPEFWKAFRLENPNGIATAQLRMAVELALHNRAQFDEWRQWAALKVVANSETPDLPVPAHILDKAALIAQCPGLKAVINGQLTQWSKHTPEVQAAKRWAIINAENLARNTSHSQRIYGLQFTDRTPAGAAFHKLLGEIGIEAQHAGQIDRVHQYRPQTVEDVQRLIDSAVDKGRHTGRLERLAYRVENFGAVVEAARQQAMGVTDAECLRWVPLIERLSELAHGFSKDTYSTEPLCSPINPLSVQPFKPGERVRKAAHSGWAGVVVSLENATQALIHWFGDAAPTICRISELELAL